jgi:hypothetical protein
MNSMFVMFKVYEFNLIYAQKMEVMINQFKSNEFSTYTPAKAEFI